MKPTSVVRVCRQSIAALALALITGELASSLMIDCRRVHQDVFGSQYEPGRPVTYRIEGNGVSHWLESGARRSPAAAPEGCAPVLCLGDSFSEALQVDDEDVYSAQLEEILSRRGIVCPVVSVGQSGTSVADYIALAKYYEDRFRPRWVVVQLGSVDLTEAWDVGRDARFEYIGADKKLEVRWTPPRAPGDRRWIERAVYTLANVSSLARYGLHRVTVMKQWWVDQPPLFNATRAEKRPRSEGDDGGVPVESELDLLCNAYGGRITLLYITPYYVPRRGLESTAIDRRVREYAEKRNISFVQMSSEYEVSARRGIALQGFSNTRPFTGHWNQAGHHAVAEALAAEIQRLAPVYGLF